MLVAFEWLGLLALFAAPAVDANAEALRLQWDAPATCPGTQEVAHRVALSIPPGERATRRVDAAATVSTSAADQWQLALVIDTGDGTITPTANAADCETLVDAAVVHLVMALEPAAAVEPSEPTEPSATDSVVPPRPPVDNDRDTPARVRGLFGGGGGVGFGLLPRVDGWIALNGGVLIRTRSQRVVSFVRAEVFVGHGLAQTQRLAAGNDAGVRVAAWWVGPRACWEPVVAGRSDLATFSFPLCGGLEFAAMAGRGEGVQQSLGATRLWFGFAAGASAQWQPLRRLGLRLGAESFVTATRPSFTLDRGAPVYTVGRAGVRALLAVQVTLP